jgi:hypothetical protein
VLEIVTHSYVGHDASPHSQTTSQVVGDVHVPEQSSPTAGEEHAPKTPMAMIPDPRASLTAQRSVVRFKSVVSRVVSP